MGAAAMAAAKAQIAAAEVPIQHQIAAERAANLARAQQQMGFAKAAAALLQGTAPRVQDTYTNAANADAGYARGLGDVSQQAVNQQAASTNDFLTKMGTPAGGLEHPADVGGTAYGLEGYIPATTLQREGAAFGSAAQMLPGYALGKGQQAAGAALNDMSNINPLRLDLGKTAAQLPSVYQNVLSQLQDEAYKKAELKLSAQKAQFDQWARVQDLKQGQVRLAQGQQRIDISSEQGQQRINIEAQRAAQSALSSNRSYRIALARLGIAQKSLQLRALKQEAKKQGGGFTPDELVHIRGQAGAIAQNAFRGMKLSDGSPDPNHPALGYKQALKQEILAGVPPSIAVWALKRAGFSVPIKGDGTGMFKGFGKYLKNVSGGVGSAVESAAGQQIVGLAHHYLGTPYVWGGRSPRGFDCSGFAQYLYGKVGISIPPTTYTQWKAGRAIPKSQLQPGDLVFFRGSDSIGSLPGHVGVYIGNGMMIDAPHTGTSVRVESVWNFGGYQGARRYGKG